MNFIFAKNIKKNICINQLVNRGNYVSIFVLSIKATSSTPRNRLHNVNPDNFSAKCCGQNLIIL